MSIQKLVYYFYFCYVFFYVLQTYFLGSILNQYFFMSLGACFAPLLSLCFADINFPHAD